MQFISEDFNNAYETDDTFKKSAEKMLTISSEIETKCVTSFQNNVGGDCVSKLSEYQASFDPIKSLNKIRANKVLEYDYHKDSVQKLTEKPSKNPLTLPKAKEQLSQAKK